MNASDIIDSVKRNLSDTHEGRRRWSDTVLMGYLDEALTQSYAIRPDIFLSSDTIAPHATIESLDTEIIDSLIPYKDALACHVCNRALLEDSSDDGNVSQGNVFLNRWKERMVNG